MKELNHLQTLIDYCDWEPLKSQAQKQLDDKTNDDYQRGYNDCGKNISDKFDQEVEKVFPKTKKLEEIKEDPLNLCHQCGFVGNMFKNGKCDKGFSEESIRTYPNCAYVPDVGA